MEIFIIIAFSLLIGMSFGSWAENRDNRKKINEMQEEIAKLKKNNI